ncbi:MAG TPA: hypothetical protein VJC16_07885 [Candidatus Nanoarchaeia archaeon]|nr:hypothetical protein [Candidatus Nanoarchaeia archaeon]
MKKQKKKSVAVSHAVPLILALADWLAQKGFQLGMPLNTGEARAIDVQNTHHRSEIIEEQEDGLAVILTNRPELSLPKGKMGLMPSITKKYHPRRRVLCFILLREKGCHVAVYGADVLSIATELSEQVALAFRMQQVCVELVDTAPRHEEPVFI